VRLERNPDLVRLASQSRLKEAELRLVQANSRPDLTLSLGLRRFEADGETALVAGVSMPMSWGNRNQGIIDEARANLSRNEAERAAALHRLRAQLFALYQGMETARMRAVRLRGEALPMAREALEQTRAGYERGRFSFLELASAQSELLEIETAALEAAADHHRLRTELERLTGEAAS
jgi:cobalt-zinc-cadmium efflux system outer membrane protein